MKDESKRFRITAGRLVAAAVILCAVQVLSFSFSVGAMASSTSPEPKPTPGKVTMIDLGADKCIPCKMMAPIIEELKKEYAGKAEILFIDVWKKPDEAKKYGIRVIPTQIFFDRNGKEVYRHTGFMEKKNIAEILNQLGAR